MKRFTRTDLALEREGCTHRREYLLHGVRVCEAEERRGRDRIRYATLHFAPLHKMSAQQSRQVTRACAQLLETCALRLVDAPGCVLVACLGNPRLTPDSLGPCTAARLEVTRHVQLLDKAAFAHFGKGALCLVTPGVLGDTGVESVELVKGAVRELGADLVIAVDALAAGNVAHLGAVVQICDHGLRPGAGMGNRRTAIARASIGCPVISVGIPTVIDSATMVCDALSRAGICGVGDGMIEHLSALHGYMVAPGDIDMIVRQGGALLAQAIGACFGMGEA